MQLLNSYDKDLTIEILTIMYELASNKITCDSVTIVSFKSAFQPVVPHLRHPLWRNKGSGLTMKNTSSAIVKKTFHSDTSKTVNHLHQCDECGCGITHLHMTQSSRCQATENLDILYY